MQTDRPIFASGSSPTGDAAENSENRSRSEPDLGHLVILLLASTLAGLRDRLDQDGFQQASTLVADLARRCDDFLAKIP